MVKPNTFQLIHLKICLFLFFVALSAGITASTPDHEVSEAFLKEVKQIIEKGNAEEIDTRKAIYEALFKLKDIKTLPAEIKSASISELRYLYHQLNAKMGDFFMSHKDYKRALKFFNNSGEISEGEKYSEKILACRKTIVSGENQSFGKLIVFVVDISTDERNNSKRKQFPQLVFKIAESLTCGDENSFRLITFSDVAKLHNGDNSETPQLLKSTLEKGLAVNSASTFPILQHGLSKVFSLLAGKFLEKAGVVVFISPGVNDPRFPFAQSQNELISLSKAINLCGFSIAGIYTPGDTPPDEKNQRQLIQAICIDAPNIFVANTLGMLTEGLLTKLSTDIFNTPNLSPISQDQYEKLKQNLDKHAVTIARAAGPGQNYLELNKRILEFLENWRTESKNTLNNQRMTYSNEKSSPEKVPNYWYIALIVALTALFSLIVFIVQRRYIRLGKQISDTVDSSLENYEKNLQKWLTKLVKELKQVLKNTKQTTPGQGDPETEDDSSARPMWGKIFYKYKRKENTIDLSQFNSGERCKDSLPTEIEFMIRDHFGEKTIALYPRQGSITFLNEKKRFYNDDRNYIGKINRYFRLNCGRKKVVFEYCFLSVLENISNKPVHEEGRFFGREDIKATLEENYSGIKPSHFIISGAANLGKTSLLRHLRYEFFPGLGKDSEPNGLCSVLYEYDYNKKPSLKDICDDIDKKIEALPMVGFATGLPKVILIDEYDKMVTDLESEIGKLFDKYAKEEFMFILSGQRCEYILPKTVSKILPQPLKVLPLQGIDNTRTAEGLDGSRALIQSLLKEMGFPVQYFPPEAQLHLAKITSGFPAIIKRIMEKAIISWLDNSGQEIIDSTAIDKAVQQNRNDEESRLLKMLYNYELEYYKNPANKKNPENKTEITLKSIVNKLKSDTDQEGKIEESEFKRRLASFEAEPDIVSEREKSFILKIKMLKNIGIVEIRHLDGKKHLYARPMLIFAGEKNAG